MIPAESVVVMPFWSQSDAMNWDSNYTYLRRVLPALTEKLPHWMWIVMWPQATRGSDTWHWSDDGLFNDPRIVRFPWPYDTSTATSVLAFDPDRFKDLELRYAPTVYWLHQAEAGLFFRGGYTQSWNLSARPAVVVQKHYIIDRSLPYPYDALFPRLWLQMGGAVGAARVVCNSDHTRAMMRRSYGEWLSSETLAALDAKTTTLRFGLVDADWLAQPVRPSPTPVILYNHRFENYKRPDDTAAVIAALRGRGLAFEVWVTQTIGQKVNKFPVDRAVGHPDQAVYRANIAVQAVNTLNSVHETFCISALDSLALGHLLVAPRAVTFPELVPPDYPFLFKNPTEQEDMLAHILSTWPDEIERWSARLRAWVAQEFTLTAYIDRYAALLGAEAAVYRKIEAKDTTIASLQAFCAALPQGTYTLDEMARRMRHATGMAQQACPNRRVVREMTGRGATLSSRQNAMMVKWAGIPAPG